MKKAILIIPIILIGCATVKKSNTETEIKKDSTSIVKIDASKFSESYTIEPVNLDKPILINGKEYLNTKIVYNNSKERIIYKDSTSNKSNLKQEINEKEKDYSELIKSVTNKIFLLILIIFIIISIVNYLKRKATIL